LNLLERHQGVNRVVDFPLKRRRVIQPMPSYQLPLGLVTEIRRSQKPLPLVRAQDFCIIRLFYFRANPGFGKKLKRRHEVIEQGAERPVDGGQRVPLCGGGEAAVADKVSDAGVVFLFDETVVVFAVGAGTGELDMFLGTPFLERLVDKLRAVVAVHAEEGEREGGFDGGEGLKNPFISFVEQGPEFHPP